MLQNQGFFAPKTGAREIDGSLILTVLPTAGELTNSHTWLRLTCFTLDLTAESQRTRRKPLIMAVCARCVCARKTKISPKLPRKACRREAATRASHPRAIFQSSLI